MEDTIVHLYKPSGSATNTSRLAQVRASNEKQTPASWLPFERESLRPITIRFEDLTYTIKLKSGESNGFWLRKSKTSRTLLNGVSGIVRPGELLALLGPSGSGKTTLLTALGGRLPGKYLGSITYNGKPFTSSLKRKTGFVTQDDVLYPHLTVIETLTYAALLKLPRSLSRKEKIEQAELILTKLGLTMCRNSIVGGLLFRGVSGGERKRVSIGHEMLVNPSLLLLDEPTSGLDSTTALRLMTTLKGLTAGDRAVVTTIHQPSSRLFWMFDKVVVLSDGCPIYSGHTDKVMEYFRSIGHEPSFNFDNPADFLLDLANDMAPSKNQDDHQGRSDDNRDQTSIKQFLRSTYKMNLQPLVKADIHQDVQDMTRHIQGTPLAESGDQQWTTSWWMQFKVLLKRGIRERRHEAYSIFRIIHVISVSIVSGLLWWQSDLVHLEDQLGFLFFFTVFWGFYPLSNSIFTFPNERPMLTRELSSGMYRLSSYFMARTAGDLPMELVLPTIFGTITYWMGGLKPSLVTFMLTVLIIVLNMLVAHGLGLALGAILMDLQQTSTSSSIIMLVFSLVGGFYVQNIPVFMDWLKYISFSHYSYKLLLEIQYTQNESYESASGVRLRVVDFPVIKSLGLGNPWWDAAVLLVMLIGYRLVAYYALRMRKYN